MHSVVPPTRAQHLLPLVRMQVQKDANNLVKTESQKEQVAVAERMARSQQMRVPTRAA